MATDKALLSHPEGGSWLERTLGLLLELNIPVTLLSRHREHLRRAQALAAAAANQEEPAPPLPVITALHDDGPACGGDPAAATPTGRAAPISGPQPWEGQPRLTAIAEPEPWQGPLLALHRLMQRYPEQRLLLCPVDMPWLRLEVLENLIQAAAEQPQQIHLAHDGERRQPLLGIYPSQGEQREALRTAIVRGERRLQGWLAGQVCREVRLDPTALRNINRPSELTDALASCDHPDLRPQR